MDVIVLDVHHPEDGRVNRHLKYMMEKADRVYRVNVNRYYPSFPVGAFSLFGEKGFRINVGGFSGSIIDRACVLAMLVLPVIAAKAYSFLKAEIRDSAGPLIIHVHDYELLITALYLRVMLPQKSVVLYDRHELYEILKGDNYILDRIPRGFERLTSRWIGGVIGVSSDHLDQLVRLFPHSLVRVVPNYPESDQGLAGTVEKKWICQSNPSPSVVYFGCLNNNLDRDTDLLLDVIELILTENEFWKAYIGGDMPGSLFLKRVEEFESKFGHRFNYLGYVPRHIVAQHTADAVIGLLFWKPEYWVSGASPNKIYEYLQCGVIPVIRAAPQNMDLISEAGLIFGRYEPKKEILEAVRSLITDQERMKTMMRSSYSIGKQFTFDVVKGEYLALYDDLLNEMRPKSLSHSGM